MQEIPISNFTFISIVIVSSVLVFLIIRLFINRRLKKAVDEINANYTHFYFIRNALGFLVFLVALIVIFYGIPELRKYGNTLFAGAGVLAAIIGFASQAAFSNIISGVFVVIFKPFRVGDLIQIGTYFGKVEDITLRHTVIRDFENKRYVIPNSLISSESIHNLSIKESVIVNQIMFGISYGSDVDLAMKILEEEAMNHPLHIDNRSTQEIADNKPEVIVRVFKLNDSSVDLRLTVATKDAYDAFDLKTDLYYRVKKRFDAEGIEIPFPHQTVYLRNDR